MVECKLIFLFNFRIKKVINNNKIFKKDCKKNPCINETRTVKCSHGDGDEKCNHLEKPIQSRQCPLPDGLICKTKAIDILNRVLKKVKDMYSDLIENRWFIYEV